MRSFSRLLWVQWLVLSGLLGACDSGGGSGMGPSPLACPGPFDAYPHEGTLFTVGDGNPASCTEAALQETIALINAEDGPTTLVFDCGGDHTFTLTETIFLDNDCLLDGEGHITLSGADAVRIIETDHYVDLTVQNLTFAHGRADEDGGAIYMPWFGNFRAVDCIFRDNHTAATGPDMGGGAIFIGGLDEAIIAGCEFTGNSGSNGGALNNRGCTLTIVDSSFSDNEATGRGGGLENGGIGGAVYVDGMNYDDPGDFIGCNNRFVSNIAGDHGGAMFLHFYDDSTATVTLTLFEDNHAQGADSGMGALYHQEAPLHLSNSLFLNNSTNLHAGALYVGQNAPATVENCTFYGNFVAEDGVGGAIFAGASTVHVTNCTFAENSANYGPAIFCGQENEFILKNNIFANNHVTGEGEYNGTSCCFTLTDGGGNIQWPATRANGGADKPCTDSVLFADPMLSAPADNGGPTYTMAIEASSPAISYATSCPDTDQRGEPRSTPCDAGAYELPGE